MFSEETLTKIFAREEIQRLDIMTQSAVVHAIEDVLEEENNADEYSEPTTNE